VQGRGAKVNTKIIFVGQKWRRQGGSVRIPRIPATQSIGRLPLSPRERWLMATLCDVMSIGHQPGACTEEAYRSKLIKIAVFSNTSVA
jgi:hypothetical protein